MQVLMQRFFLNLYSRSTEKGGISVVWTEGSRRLPRDEGWGAPFQETGNHLCLNPTGCREAGLPRCESPSAPDAFPLTTSGPEVPQCSLI